MPPTEIKPDAAAELAQRNADEQIIKGKMAAGLTREQAEASLRNQRACEPKITELKKQTEALRAKNKPAAK